MKLRVWFFAFVFLVAALPAFAQVSLTTLDTAYTQNFDTLANTGTTNTWTNGTTLPGWYAQRSSGTLSTYIGDNGGSNTGGLHSLGTTATTERALGALKSGSTLTMYFGVVLQNNTGSTINALDVSFDGEQWRNGNAAATTLAFSYVTGSSFTGALTDFTAAGTSVPALNFTSPVFGGTAAVDGNNAGKVANINTTITGINIPAGGEILLRWADPGPASGSDHDLGIDNFSVTPHHVIGFSVNDVSQNEGDSGTSNFTFNVTLSEALASTVSVDVATADGTATAGTDYTAVSTTTLTFNPGDPLTQTVDVSVNGDNTLEPNETFFVNLSNAVGTSIIRGQGMGTIVNDDFQFVKIHDVQGSVAGTTPGTDDISPLNGQSVSVEGVVTSNLLGSDRLKGFFMQEEDADADADPTTSEGIFVFCGTCVGTEVAEGQRVLVKGGQVQEFSGMTELSVTPAKLVVTDAGNHLAEVTPVHVTLPVTGNVNSFYESVEGMLVAYDTLTVSEYFQLYRYGQVVLVGGLANDTYMNTVGDGRPRTFTEDHTPNAGDYANHLAELARGQVILDDDRDGDEAQLLEPAQHQYVYWPQDNGGFSLGTQGQDFFRGGDQVQNLVGVVQWARPGSAGSPANTWRIRPSASYPVTFTPVNTRPATPPDVGGSIRAVGMNLLNYFTTLDTTATGCSPSHSMECRGANSAQELDRQTQRAAGVICTLNPDVAAFMELENNDVPTANYTINHLLGAVNLRCGGAHPYDFVAITDNGSSGTLGSDAIRVMQVYRTGVLAPHGAPLYDSNPIHNRPPTAQAYDVVDSANPAFGKRFIVVANHLKSKGSCPGSGADADQLDGQGCWADTRTQQANATMSWINGTVLPATETDNVLLLGDFNSYAHETPVTTLEGGGYSDMETELHGLNGYSYLFSGELGHLDYAFANGKLKPEITGADAWHINADEADLFDYNDTVQDPREATFDAKPDGTGFANPRVFWDTSWDDNTVGLFRASDHDPVVVGLFRSTDLAIVIAGAPDPVTAGTNLTYTVSVANNGGTDAPAATWSTTLPSGTTFVSLTNDPAWSCATPTVGASGTVNCGSNAPFAAGANASFTLVVAVDASVAGGTMLSATATVSSDIDETNPADNSATATTTVSAAPVGNLTITPTSIDFGDQTVGTTSGEHTVTLGNNGTAALSVTTLTAASGAFALTGTGTCGPTPIAIAAGDSCTLTYTFTPAATGAANQTLTVDADSAGNGSIALAGNGVQGNLTITPTSIGFGNQVLGTTSSQQIVTLGNDGTASLDATVTVAAAPFARQGGTCAMSGTITIAAGSTCTLTYTFAPTATGDASQSLTLTSSGTGAGTIDLHGTGVPSQADVAVSIDDGAEYASVGGTVSYTIVVSNTIGPIATAVTVSDILPANLDNGAWTCVGSGGATCGAGIASNTLSDVANLPVGSSVTYTYTATVIAEDTGYVVNTATAATNGGVTDPNAANNTARDTDTLVIFRDGFENL